MFVDGQEEKMATNRDENPARASDAKLLSVTN